MILTALATIVTTITRMAMKREEEVVVVKEEEGEGEGAGGRGGSRGRGTVARQHSRTCTARRRQSMQLETTEVTADVRGRDASLPNTDFSRGISCDLVSVARVTICDGG